MARTYLVLFSSPRVDRSLLESVENFMIEEVTHCPFCLGLWQRCQI